MELFFENIKNEIENFSAQLLNSENVYKEFLERTEVYQ